MERFQNLLKSLSRISPVDFVIGDREEILFSTRSRSEDKGFHASLRRFSARVFEENAFRGEANGLPYALYGAPIRCADLPVAALIGYQKNGHPSHHAGGRKEMEDLLAALASLFGDWTSAQKERDDMAEQLAQSFEAISLYARITPQITSFGFSGTTLAALTEDLLETIGGDVIFTSLPGRSGYSRCFERKDGVSILDRDRFIETLLKGVPEDGDVLKDDYFIVNDSRSVPLYDALGLPPFRLIVIRIQHQSDTYGWLGMASFNLKEIFRYSDLRMLASVAKQIGVALTNIDLYRELEQFFVNVVKSLVYTIEAKDVYTRGHSERVSHYCMLMADRLGLGKEEKRSLLWASILHDMGKIGIPERMLNKPGRLTEEEYEQIKMHVEKGYNILKPLKPLAQSLDGILYHHEHYDGKGYPKGLKGTDIPLLARIIAVADTYDAITSDRSYRSRKTREKALTVMAEIAGSQLDPEIVPAFLAILREGAGTGTESGFPKEMQEDK
jgi:hypothetical protein